MPSTLLITNEQKQLLNLQQLIMDSASRPMIQKFKSHPNYFKTISENLYWYGRPFQYSSWNHRGSRRYKPFATIADEEYDNLFLVTIKKNGTAKVRAMKYGTKSQKLN
jgi:hypothetical protein